MGKQKPQGGGFMLQAMEGEKFQKTAPKRSQFVIDTTEHLSRKAFRKAQKKCRSYKKKNITRNRKGRCRSRTPKNNHHMTNKCRGGKKVPNNSLRMKVLRHDALHICFDNMSWEEIQDALDLIVLHSRFKNKSLEKIQDELYIIFHQRDPAKCIQTMVRISRFKARSNA